MSADAEGDLPCEADRLSAALISYYRINRQGSVSDIYDAGGGLYNRLRNSSFKANTISALIADAETKKYTNARLRRAMWNGFFGVTSSDVKTPPRFTQILAMDSIGIKELKKIKKRCSISILTKPSGVIVERLVPEPLIYITLPSFAEVLPPPASTSSSLLP
jgi:predicted nucleotidyltransferase